MSGDNLQRFISILKWLQTSISRRGTCREGAIFNIDLTQNNIETGQNNIELRFSRLKWDKTD